MERERLGGAEEVARRAHPGETKSNQAIQVVFKGFEIDGLQGERTRALGDSQQSEATLLLADKLSVRVSVRPTDNEDEAIEVLKQLDVAALNAFAKTMKSRGSRRADAERAAEPGHVRAARYSIFSELSVNVPPSAV